MSKKSTKKVDNLLSFGSFLMVILIGFYYGFNWSLPAVFAASFAAAAYRKLDHPTLFDSINSLSSPYIGLLLVGIINKTMIPIALTGLVANILGYSLFRFGKPVLALVLTVGSVLSFVAAATAFPEFMRSSLSDDFERPMGQVLIEDNKNNKFRAFEGDIAVINFWASWCGPCRNEMKEFEELAVKYGENNRVGLYFINADPREGWVEIETFKEQTGLKLPFYNDVRGLTGEAFRVTRYPTTLIVKNNRVVYTHKGYMKGEQIGAFLDHEIQKVLAE